MIDADPRALVETVRRQSSSAAASAINFHWACQSSLIVPRTSHIAPAQAYAANRSAACAGVPVIGRSTASSGGMPRPVDE
jgi:hypothetical protein